MEKYTLTLVLVAALVCGVVLSTPATARFRGTVTSTDANAVTISEVQVGDVVTGQFSFDTTAADGMPSDPDSGLYTAEQLSLSIRDFEYSASGNNISISNDRVVIPGEPAVDAYEVVSPLREITGPSLSGLPPAQIDIVLVDTGASVFSDDSLPLSLPLDEFEIVSEVPYGTTGGRLIFQSTGTGGLGEVRFEITQLTIEPASVDSSDVIVYPQLAVGGGYQVVLILNNASGAAWQGTIEPLLDDGSLDYLVTQIGLQPRETRKLTLTGGADAVTTGLVLRAAEGSSTAALSVAYFFNYFEAGVLKDSTGVPAAAASTRFTFPVEGTNQIDTGFAIRRLPTQTDSPITLSLYAADGTLVADSPSGSDTAQFFTEVFTGLPGDFTGSLVAESADPFYLVVLRLEYTADGFQLTSVPARAD